MTIEISMELDKEAEKELTLPFDYEKIARDVIFAAMEAEQLPYEAEVSLLLTDDSGIWQYNKEFRQIDAPTDVLSFPMIEYKAPADFRDLDQREDCFNSETGELLLGDIVISLTRVFAQAERYGHSPLREFAFLIAHSMLHLMGYDHVQPEEAAVMEERQEAILAGLLIER